ncbi:predicted protein [Histoplasma capsulatum G186AR]|uniref:Uncharacterized protein n=1 Tax=Ajellomyces capsulatus (strain G186AR / H82 / ATCC MYA-2454 / RMSCC 2432) TaxID=447093 RepID=C0NQB3_AJECG|nr:uncharacterized protein HCBG_05701 [Histoplasma capsulatum G186AR]EEH06385.1 predicted protein [Histoplasma capsulatum G186AR]
MYEEESRTSGRDFGEEGGGRWRRGEEVGRYDNSSGGLIERRMGGKKRKKEKKKKLSLNPALLGTIGTPTTVNGGSFSQEEVGNLGQRKAKQPCEERKKDVPERMGEKEKVQQIVCIACFVNAVDAE